jgi:hypothetical protein
LNFTASSSAECRIELRTRCGGSGYRWYAAASKAQLPLSTYVCRLRRALGDVYGTSDGAIGGEVLPRPSTSEARSDSGVLTDPAAADADGFSSLASVVSSLTAGVMRSGAAVAVVTSSDGFSKSQPKTRTTGGN